MKKILLLIIVFMAAACKKDSDKLSRANSITKIDLKDAVSLVTFENSNTLKGVATIKSRDSGTPAANTSSNLFKIKADGTLENVFYLTKEGESATNNVLLNVQQICSINDDYFVLSGDFSFSVDSTVAPEYYEALLIRKSDGAIFDYGKFDFDQIQGLNNLYRPSTFTDFDGNIYYRSYDSYDGRTTITRLSLQNPDKIIKEDYLPEGQSLTDAAVDGEGNVAYVSNSSENRLGFRIKRNSGSISFIPVSAPGYMFWIGANGKLYLFDYDYSDISNPTSYIGIVSFNNNNGVNVNKVWSQKACSDCERFGLGQYRYMKILNSDGVTFIEPGTGIWKFKEPNNSMNFIPVKNFGGEIVGMSKKNIFLKQGNQLAKLSLDNYIVTTVPDFTFNGYDIYSMKVYDNDIFEFSALRYSDGVKIIAQVDQNGKYQVIDDKTNQKAVVLERIN